MCLLPTTATTTVSKFCTSSNKYYSNWEFNAYLDVNFCCESTFRQVLSTIDGLANDVWNNLAWRVFTGSLLMGKMWKDSPYENVILYSSAI